jgi:hypothetical protein
MPCFVITITLINKKDLSEYMSKLPGRAYAPQENPKTFHDQMELIASKGGKGKMEKTEWAGYCALSCPNPLGGSMIAQVTYQSKIDAATEQTNFTQTEFFEANTLPDRPTIVKKLLEMGVEFAEETLLIAAYIDEDADTIRKGGFRITEL